MPDPVTYRRAEEVRDIAEALIPEYHPHLHGETILYVFRSKATERKFKPVLGTARRVSGLNAYLAFQEMGEDAEPFYVIEIAEDIWGRLAEAQRVALVDHELSHIGPDGMLTHDVEEFRAVVERHGLWMPDLHDFAKAAKSLPLFEAARAHVEAMRPKKGSGIDSLTISTPGGDSVTLNARDIH